MSRVTQGGNTNRHEGKQAYAALAGLSTLPIAAPETTALGYLNVVVEVLTRAEVIFDKFHVLQHASAALDDVRRQEFFRAGPVMRKHGRGKQMAPVAPVENGARV
jgi:hypothetical protein